MLKAVLFLAGICTALGFNIHKMPVRNLSNEDPLFGQTIIQSMDGFFVPSPNSGAVFRCTEERCSKMTDTDVTKGLSPIASVASSFKEDEDKVLVCHQVRTRNSSTEYFNGNCAYITDHQKKSRIYPDKLVLQLLEENTNNINPSQKSHDQAHGRKRRAVENESGTNEDDNDDDAGTEIVFVLDGSGSIIEEDFTMAKEFIHNVMNNVWTTCFSCNFAIVQFGKEIRTELSLQENNDSLNALNKVKNIQQVMSITKTASALYHVLTDVFVPEHGSKENAKKMIILLSDGKMAGDNRSLTDVLEMKEMDGIVRYAIGVGSDVLNKVSAVEEMIEIAGSSDRFFNVSNYAALEKILSSLEKSIIGIEGLQKGAGFELQLAEAGFSSHITRDGSILFGAVGAYDWSGGIILTQNNVPVAFLNATKEEPRFSYLGYSVASAYTDSNTLYLSGAPRYNLTGAVFIFNGASQKLLQGDQVGSYFGSVLCVLDINSDDETDYLLVGAPHFHLKGEEGKVLIYKLTNGEFKKDISELRGLERHIHARFGSAVVDIGDVDANGFRDVAVGAPLEENNEGCVYIYNGFQDGIRNQFSQRITPSDFGNKLVHFGQAVNVMSSTQTRQKLLGVGSEGVISFFQIIPVIGITPSIKVYDSKPIKKIPPEKQNNEESSKFQAKLSICFNTPKGDIKSGQLPIEYYIELDSGKEQKRLVHVSHHEGKMNFTLTNSQTCSEAIDLKYVGCSDCFSPIKIRVNFSLPPSTIRVLDAYSPKEATEEIVFEKQCRNLNCKANISLADSELSNGILTIGSGQTLDIKFNLMNYGDNSYMTTLTLTYPEMLSFKKSEGGTCDDKNNNRQIVCKLLYPIFKRNEQTSVTVVWQPVNRNANHTPSITALLTGGANGSEVLNRKTYSFKVKKALKVQLVGKAQPNTLNITENEEHKPQLLHISFKLLGENTYDAKITVTITIEKQAQKTDIKSIKCEPKDCSWNYVGNDGRTYRVACTMTKLQDINITAETHIYDIEGESEKITATGEITYDESIYDGKNIIKRQQVDVLLIKLTVVKSIALILGSSIGGFLLLTIIIIILIKCGFFRRRHKVDHRQSTI